MDHAQFRRALASGATKLIFTLVFLACAGNSYAQKFSVLTLDLLPGGSNMYTTALNNNDQIVGAADDFLGDWAPVIWNHGKATAIFGPGPTFGGRANGINNLGQVVGYDDDPFMWSPTVTYSRNNEFQSAKAINDAGQIVGDYLVGGNGGAVLWANPADLSNGLLGGVPLVPGGDCEDSASGINDAGQIVGFVYFCDSGAFHAARWTTTTGTDLGTLGGMNSDAYAINVHGASVGWADISNGRQHAALWPLHARVFDLGTLGGHESYASGINAEGDVVGSAQTSYGAWHAVLWTHKDYKAVDLNTEISAALAQTITLVEATGTNDHCRVLVNGYDNKTGAQRSYLLSLTNQSNCNEP
jgi:probable HAF family extracellular repeat protein